jgi:hypothetical protein
VTDARRIASKVSGTRSWVEVLKRFATHPIAVASYQAPIVNDPDSLRAAVASVGAAFYQGALYGPLEVLDLFWDDYTSCELQVSEFAVRVDRYPPRANILKVMSSFQRCPAVLVGEDEALLPKSVLIPLLKCLEIGLYTEKEPSRSVNDLRDPFPFSIRSLPSRMQPTREEVRPL